MSFIVHYWNIFAAKNNAPAYRITLLHLKNSRLLYSFQIVESPFFALEPQWALYFLFSKRSTSIHQTEIVSQIKGPLEFMNYSQWYPFSLDTIPRSLFFFINDFIFSTLLNILWPSGKSFTLIVFGHHIHRLLQMLLCRMYKLFSNTVPSVNIISDWGLNFQKYSSSSSNKSIDKNELTVC